MSAVPFYVSRLPSSFGGFTQMHEWSRIYSFQTGGSNVLLCSPPPHPTLIHSIFAEQTRSQPRRLAMPDAEQISRQRLRLLSGGNPRVPLMNTKSRLRHTQQGRPGTFPIDQYQRSSFIPLRLHSPPHLQDVSWSMVERQQEIAPTIGAKRRLFYYTSFCRST